MSESISLTPERRMVVRALVCDDDSVMGRIVGDTLIATFPRAAGVTLESSEACEAVITRNAFDALSRLRREKFDLLVTDILLPRMDGIELILEARRLDVPPKIVAYSGDGELGRFTSGPSFLEVAKTLGADWAFSRRTVSAELVDLIVQGKLSFDRDT